MQQIDLRNRDLSKLTPAARQRLERELKDLERRDLCESFAGPGGLMRWVRYMWSACEPTTPMIEDWPLHAIADHLEAVARGKITRLLINVCPGAMKSLLTSVFFPTWVWGPLGRPSSRFLNLSFSCGLPERDNRRALQVINSEKFQRLYDSFTLTKEGEELIETSATGFKQASGVQSVTGRRADFLIYDDPNNVADVESDTIRETVARNFKEAASNRLNNLTKSAIIIVQQRSHEGDVSGVIIEDQMDYVHLCLPALFEEPRCETYVDGELFFRDPREEEGEIFFPERFPPNAIAEEMAKGPFYWNGQFMQRPENRGGSILRREWWTPWTERFAPKCDGDAGWIIASLDPAYTSNKKKNDPSGFTIWGCFNHPKDGNRGVILLYAARLWKDLCGPDLPREPDESYQEWRLRTQHTWGLVETIHDACLKFKVKALYVENKGPGLSVIQAMERELRRSRYRYAVNVFDPGNLDKAARAHRVQPQFAAGQIYAPYRDGQPLAFAVPVIDECAACPNGKKDDLFNSATAAIWILRTTGFLDHPAEQFLAKEDAARDWRPKRALYNI